MKAMISKCMSKIAARQFENISNLSVPCQEEGPLGFKYIIKIYGKHIRKNKCVGHAIWEIDMEQNYEPVSYNILMLQYMYIKLGFINILYKNE